MAVVREIVGELAALPMTHLVMLLGIGALALSGFAIHAVLVLAKKGAGK